MTLEDGYSQAQNYPVYKKKPSRSVFRKSSFSAFFPMAELLDGEPLINAKIQVAINVEGQTSYRTIQRVTKSGKSARWYYAPIAQTRYGDYAIHVRRTAKGGLNLVRRHLEPVEKTYAFRLYESWPVSFLMYHTAHLVRHFSKSTVNTYFEKHASKAEEGTFEIFQKVRSAEGTRNFFLITKDAADYVWLKDEADVVPKFSLKSYWLTYRANNIIATEAPAHANVLRSNNKYIRSAPFSQKFVLLQHGVTYMKAVDKKGTFRKGREGEADHIVVSGKKERDAVVEMFGVDEEHTIKAGLPIFDQLIHDHITQKSSDIVTIMLTWKPYDEHFQDFTQSSYYQTVIEVFDTLRKVVPTDNIRIVAHPKFTQHLSRTQIRESVWTGCISEVLAQTKLLITDYSSVCYNVFYQGGAVCFYQPDLERYERENGQLIPTPDEYIGRRTLTIQGLSQILQASIRDGIIDLPKLRTAEHAKRYKQINEFSDGRNVDRIINRLQQLSFVETPRSPGSQMNSGKLESLQE